MNINMIHDLENLTLDTIKEHQEKLKSKIDLTNKIQIEDIKICAGVDIAYWEKDNTSYGVCSIVLIDFKSKKVLDKVSSFGEITADYIAGYLTMRELPLIMEAVKNIPPHLEPDLFMFDGNGILHPKSMGIATHASFFLDKPTIGVAKSYLRISDIDYTQPPNNEFAYTNIEIDNEIRGVAFRSHKDTKPIFISPGNFIDIESAILCTKELMTKESKLPITTRYADLETHILRDLYNK